MNKSFAFLGVALAAASLTAAESASAQSFLLPSSPAKGVSLETTHTQFKDFDADLPTSVWFLSGRLPLTPRISAVADIPFSHAKLDMFGEGKESSSVFGNPYLGVEFAASRGFIVELGARAPLNTADEESFADMIAFVADPLRPEAFLEELVPVTAAATYQRALPAGFGVRARGGVTTLFFTGEESSDPEAAVDYGLIGSYTAGPAQVALGFSGRWYASSDEGNFSETSMHHAGLSADVQVGRVRPGVALRVPIDSDYRQVVKSSVGLYLQVPLQ